MRTLQFGSTSKFGVEGPPFHYFQSFRRPHELVDRILRTVWIEKVRLCRVIVEEVHLFPFGLHTHSVDAKYKRLLPRFTVRGGEQDPVHICLQRSLRLRLRDWRLASPEHPPSSEPKAGFQPSLAGARSSFNTASTNSIPRLHPTITIKMEAV